MINLDLRHDKLETQPWKQQQNILKKNVLIKTYKNCNEPNCSFDGRLITRKYERNKAVRKSCSVTSRDAHIRYNPYVTRLPLGESP